jgi:phosphoglycolate phosphatase
LHWILFDLDGTLVDSREGIVRSMAYALGQLGRPVPADEVLRATIGAPLHLSFAHLLKTSDEALAWEAVRLYRVRYEEAGIFEQTPYPGMRELLCGLRGPDRRLCVATSKPEKYARIIVAHFGLGDALDAVYGSEMDGTRTGKPELLAHVLAGEDADPARTIMVGDRVHDIDGAQGHGLATAAVMWGYGTRVELAGADWICETSADLAGRLRQWCEALA